MERLSYSWEDDPVSATLIEKMQISGVIELEAKEYLRPIFKWTKQGSKSYSIDRANSFAEYLVTISKVGDSSRNILRNNSIQAKYAFNILITMAQRRGSSSDAWTSYLRIIHHGYEPDVFTMTALIGKYLNLITQHMYHSNRMTPLIEVIVTTFCFRCYWEK